MPWSMHPDVDSRCASLFQIVRHGRHGKLLWRKLVLKHETERRRGLSFCQLHWEIQLVLDDVPQCIVQVFSCLNVLESHAPGQGQPA